MTRRACPRRHGSASPEPAASPPRAPLLREACADPAEVLALSVSRFVAAAAMTGDAACWDAAHDCAEALLGPVEGAQLVGSMAAVMRAIRAERAGDWSFMPATCCRLTPDETALAQSIGIARRGRPADLFDAARALAGGAPAPRIAASLEAAAAMLDAVELTLAPAVSGQGMALKH